jgi:hypothetical protein
MAKSVKCQYISKCHTVIPLGDVGAKSVVIRTSGNEKLGVTVMILCWLVSMCDNELNELCLKVQLPMGQIIMCLIQGWMSNELMRDWLQAVWNRRPVIMLTEQGMLVSGISEDLLMLDAKSVIPAMNTGHYLE